MYQLMCNIGKHVYLMVQLKLLSNETKPLLDLVFLKSSVDGVGGYILFSSYLWAYFSERCRRAEHLSFFLIKITLQKSKANVKLQKLRWSRKGRQLANCNLTMTKGNTKTKTMTKTNTSREHLQRATLESCDLCYIWSELCGDMTWILKRRWQMQRQRQWWREINLENTFKEQP